MKRALIASMLLALAACGGGTDDSGPAQPVDLEPANPAAGCGAVVRFPEEGHDHVPAGTKVEYQTQPPTSGNHNPVWAKTGTHATEITDEQQVHNLEHGAVLIQYVPEALDPAVLDGLIAITRANREWVLLAPRAVSRFVPAAVLAFTAWRTMQTCPQPTVGAVDEARAFVARYKEHGREKIAGQPILEVPPRKAAGSSATPSPSG